MKYLICFFVFCSVLALAVFIWRRLRFKRMINVFLIDFFEKNALPQSQLNLFLCSISSLTTDFIVKQPRKVQRQIFIDLAKHKSDALIKTAKQKEPVLAKVLKALLADGKNVKIKASEAETAFAKLMLGLGFYQTQNLPELEKTLCRLPRFLKSKKHRVLKEFIAARVLFLKTDFQKSTLKITRCLPYFIKNGFVDEAAYSYFMLGEMHRLAEMADPAEIFFADGLKIYQKCENVCGVALINLVKAMLFLKQERLEDANICLKTAHNIYQKIGDSFGLLQVIAQEVIFENLNQNYDEAVKKGKKTLKMLKNQKDNVASMLLNQEIALACWYQEKYVDALAFLHEAKRQSALLKDHSSEAKNLYLLAVTFQNLSRIEEAQKYFSDLKKYVKKHGISFLDEEIRRMEKDFIL